jgi:hypothetical protein
VHTSGYAERGGIVRFACAWSADEDNIFFVCDELKSFEFIEFAVKFVGVLSTVKVNEILFNGEMRLSGSTHYAVIGTLFGFAAGAQNTAI